MATDFPYVSDTDLTYYHNRIATVFASQQDLDTLEAEVQELITEGGEPNVIETVKVNGTALVPDAQKAVDVNVPIMNGTATSIDIENADNGSGIVFTADTTAGTVEVMMKESSSESYSGTLATTDYVDANGGKIDSISVNGTAQTIDANKNVDLAVPKISYVSMSGGTGALSTFEEIKAAIDAGNIMMFGTEGNAQYPNIIQVANNRVDFRVVQADKINSYVVTSSGWTNSVIKDFAEQSDIPTAVSALTNDSGYQTAGDVSTAISTAVSSAYKYKGSVAAVADLPSTGQTVGDVYDVQATGMNYAWNGTAWDALGTYVDTSTLWAKSELRPMTTAEIDALFE